MNLLSRLAGSSLGKKYLMAVTGLLLILFVLAHMTGNLLIYAGPDVLNSYAAGLKHRPALLWGARTGLALVFAVHIWLGLSLARQNRAARGVGYAREATLQASWASRNMVLTGLVLLAFVVYHLAHFTLGVVHEARTQSIPGGTYVLDTPKNYLDLTEVIHPDGREFEATPGVDLRTLAPSTHARQDVYSMVLAGFTNPWITLSYLVAMVFLGLHLWHGGSSFLQTLGLSSVGKKGFARSVGPVLAMIVMAGNCSIPLAVYLHILK